MTGKWTPGPWVVCRDERRHHQWRVESADGSAWIADIYQVVRGDFAEIEANAHLSAAAPALYEALQLILPLAKGYASENRVGSNAEYIAAAERALSQALGEGQ